MTQALADLGKQSDTAWAQEKLYQMVTYRVNRDLPTVVTSNWTEREAAFYHGRIASRLKTAVPEVHIAAPDARNKIGGGAIVPPTRRAAFLSICALLVLTNAVLQ